MLFDISRKVIKARGNNANAGKKKKLLLADIPVKAVFM